MKNTFGLFGAIVVAIGLTGCSMFSDYPIKVETKVATWPGNVARAAALVFDDGCESQVINAIPMLERYRIPATFYPIPDARWVLARRDFWENDFFKLQMAHLGSQTYGYYGAATATAAYEEIRRGDQWVRKVMKLDEPVLVSYAPPARVKWPLDSDLERAWCLERSILVRNEGMLLIPGKEYADSLGVLSALRERGDELTTIKFFGVGGDWFSFPAAEFEKVLQALEQMRNKQELFIAPMVELNKYAELRDTLEVVSSEQIDDDEILVMLNWRKDLDLKLFDIPVELAIKLPIGWKRAGIFINEGAKTEVKIVNGFALCKVNSLTQKLLLVRN